MMRISTRTFTRNVTTATFDDIDVELSMTPSYDGHILAERVGNKLVVAYPVYDMDPLNPLKEFDGQGSIYTRREGVVTDDERALNAALGLDSNGCPRIDDDFPCEPYVGPTGVTRRSHSLRDMAAAELLPVISADADDMSDWLVADGWLESVDDNGIGVIGWRGEKLPSDVQATLCNGSVEEAAAAMQTELWKELEDPNGLFSDRVGERADELFKQHWRKLAEDLAVPLCYSSGRGDTCITPEEWDGDWEDAPNAVWVPDDCAEQGIGEGSRQGVEYHVRYECPHWVTRDIAGDVLVQIDGTFVKGFETHVEAQEWVEENHGHRPKSREWAAWLYAKGVASEYARWCSGDVYGCVVEVFELQDDGESWEQISIDSCWGFIGSDYALENLKGEFFEPTLKALRNAIDTNQQTEQA